MGSGCPVFSFTRTICEESTRTWTCTVSGCCERFWQMSTDSSFSLPLTTHTLPYGEAKPRLGEKVDILTVSLLKALLHDTQCRVDSLKQRQKLQELGTLSLRSSTWQVIVLGQNHPDPGDCPWWPCSSTLLSSLFLKKAGPLKHSTEAERSGGEKWAREEVKDLSNLFLMNGKCSGTSEYHYGVLKLPIGTVIT